jgi:hypothetical protein
VAGVVAGGTRLAFRLNDAPSPQSR